MRARLLCLLALAACAAGAVGGAAPQDPCVEPTMDRARWTPATLRGFGIQVAPGYSTLPYQGIDSDVAGWARGGRQLMYDFGQYSGPYHRAERHRACMECRAIVRGDTVAIATYHTADDRFGVHAYWPRAIETTIVQGGTVRDHLMLYGEATDEAGRRELLAMIWSVRLSR